LEDEALPNGPTTLFITPPPANIDTDEDSGDEDNGGNYNNLTGRQLQSEAELVVSNGDEETRITDIGIDEPTVPVPNSSHNSVPGTSSNSLRDIRFPRDLAGCSTPSNQISDPQSPSPVPPVALPPKPQAANRRWKNNTDLPISSRSWIEDHQSPPATLSKFDQNKSWEPVDLFELFFDNELCDEIAKQSVLYAVQKGCENYSFSAQKLKAVFGIMIITGYSTATNRRMYWEHAYDAHNIAIASTMSRDEFETALRYLHLADNTDLGGNDRIAKVRPYFSALASNFRKFCVWEEDSSIDECMVPYYGRHSCKQYIRGKPIRFGYKLWCHNLRHGYLIDFEMYQGSTGGKLPMQEEFGLGGGVILHFAGQLPKTDTGDFYKHALYCDNFFTSLKLVDYCRYAGIGLTGTVRQNRIENCPLPDNSIVKKKPRGHCETAYDSQSKSVVCKWNDNSVVSLVSNVHGKEPIQSAARWNVAAHKKTVLPQPNLIHQYNIYMGGTDRMDQNIAEMRIHVRKRKWWWPLFTFGIDAALNNAWLLYRLTPANKPMTQLEFRRSVAQTYTQRFKATVKIGRPLSLKNPEPANLRKKVCGRVQTAVRTDGSNHSLEKQATRTRCGLCSKHAGQKCIKCNVALHNKCFNQFHTQ